VRSTIWANRSNGQLLTHSNRLGTHLDSEIHFFTPGKDIASLDLNDFLTGPAAVVDLSDAIGDYPIYTAETIVAAAERSGMIEERAEVREGDILIIHTGYHHFGWDQPRTRPTRSATWSSTPGRTASLPSGAWRKKIKWIGVDCGSADHPRLALARQHK
jgi:kynurenine formamidase